MDKSAGFIGQRIWEYSPKLIEIGGNRSASVAMILRNLETDPEIFYIERAKNEKDPWSGQIAFPGGNMESQDLDSCATARRETQEEVAIQLPADSLLARLDDLQGRNNNEEIPLIISCFVFNLKTPQKVIHSPEVGDSFWIRIAELQHPGNRIQYRTPYSDSPYPGIRFPSGKVLWGLTYRFVQRFLEVIE